jgi:O-antigen ligase
LLGLITALIVARPLVLGEDPGLLDRSSSATGLVLTLLWFLAAVGWALWRGWSGQASWSLGAVEGGLLAVVGAVMTSALGAASYKQPAWLIVSEWLVFLIAFVLVRQLARTEGDNRRLLAALLASAVSLSVYAIYQRVDEMPRRHRQLDDPRQLALAVGKQEGIYLDENDPQLDYWRKRVQSNAVYATFGHPNAFGSYLALLLPAAVGLTLATQRRWTEDRRSRIEDRGSKVEDGGSKIEDEGPKNASALSILHSRSSILDSRSSARIWLAGACALLIAVALWLNNGRAAILVSIVAVGGVFALNRARSVSDGSRSPVAHAPGSEPHAPGSDTSAPGSDRRRLLGIATAVVAAVLLVFFLNRTDALKEEASGTMQKRFDYWTATVSMIRDHPWLGVGPGHFGRFYPRYMKETAFQKVKDPHNFALEMWSACGIFALLALLVAIGGFFWQTRRAWFESEKDQEKDQLGLQEIATKDTGWPFYLGGMAGLTLGFVLWALDLGKEGLSDRMTVGTFVAGIRALVWFASFGLFESISWTGAGRVRALVLGVIALLATFLVSGGIGYPSLAQSLWIVAALAVNSLEQPIAMRRSTSWLPIIGPLPVTVAICLGFFVFIYSPVRTCSAPLREARSYYDRYFEKSTEARDKESPSLAQDAGYEAQKTLNIIINQLKLSALGRPKQREEALLATPFVELAEWQAEEWKHNYRHGEAQIEIRQNARAAADQAIRLDPDGLEGYGAKYHINLIFAKGAVTEANKFYEDASKAMEELVKRDPTEARFHFELADLRFQLDDTAGWEKESQESLRLNQVASDPTRKLKASQRLIILSRQDPTNIGIRFDLAQALYLEGDTERGKKTAEEVQRLDQETNAPAKLTDTQRQQLQAWLKSG